MCRFLAAHDSQPFDIGSHLRQLAVIAKESSEYQGDGWGCAWLEGSRWRLFRNLRPIWECNLSEFGTTTLLLAHARSAFRNEGLETENNMPFLAGEAVFVFNGELRGVRIQASGRIGAEKLFHFLQRYDGPGWPAGLAKAVEIVRKRSRYIRAMNFALARREALYIHSFWSETPEYFTLHKKQAGTHYMVCSQPFRGETDWIPMPNHSLEVHSF